MFVSFETPLIFYFFPENLFFFPLVSTKNKIKTNHNFSNNTQEKLPRKLTAESTTPFAS